MKEIIMEFSKTPVGVVISTGIFILLVVILFLSKTDFGKRISKKAKNIANEAKSKAEEVNNSFKKTKEDLNNKEKELVNHCEEIVACAEEHSKEIDNLLYEILPLLHNKKIDEILEKYKSQATDRIKEISAIVAEKEKEFSDMYDQKSAEIDSKLAELDKLLVEIKNYSVTDEKEVENEQE